MFAGLPSRGHREYFRDLFQITHCVSLPPRDGSPGGHPLNRHLLLLCLGLLTDSAMISWPLQIPSTSTFCVGDLWPLADRVWWQLVSVCTGELLLEASSISPALPKLNPTLSISPLKMFPFLFSLLISLLNDVFLFLSTLLFLFSYSFLFITCSSPSSSLTFPLQSPIPSLLLHLPAPRNPKRARSPGIHQYWLRVFLVMGAEG